MSMVYQKDKRSGHTYAYENRRVWSEERQKYVNQRKLIGRVVNMETKEIVPTDGRGRRRSPYLTDEEKATLHTEEPAQFSSAISSPDNKHTPKSKNQSSDADALLTRDSMEQLVNAIKGIQKELETLRNLLDEKLNNNDEQ